MTNEEAQKAVEAYFAATQSGDVESWVSRFAPNAKVEDPIGSGVLADAKAIRQQGEVFLGSFRDVGLYPEFVHVSGNRAAAKWIGKGTTTEGKNVEFDGINVWQFTPNGQVESLVGYWNPSEMREV